MTEITGSRLVLACAVSFAVAAACAPAPIGGFSGSDAPSQDQDPESPTTPKGSSKKDAGAEPKGDDDDSAPPKKSGSAGACIEKAASSGDGHHNPGKDCLSCHATLDGLKWTIAGTLFKSGGKVGEVGATIEVTTATGKVVTLNTAANGNFWTDEAIDLPVKPRASLCPADQAMKAKAENGSCNSCHDATQPLHL